MQPPEVAARIDGLPPDKARAVVCALIGHSRIVHTCMGYIYCARCEAQIGDSLGGASNTKDNVIVGHDCEVCRENFKGFDWRDTFMTPDPFDAEKVREMKEAGDRLKDFLASKELESRPSTEGSSGLPESE